MPCATFDQQAIAVELHQELNDNSLKVILIPAPEPKHCIHCIRVAAEQNVKWYRTKFAELGYIKRSALLKAFKRIYCGKPLKYKYDFIALEIIDNRVLENQEKLKERLNHELDN